MNTVTAEKRVHNADQPERTRGGRTYVPAVDILELPNELLLLADLPGVTPEQIDINYERGQLTLSASVPPRQPESHNYLSREYGVGDFFRTFQIGDGIDASHIQAEVRDGVLTLHLPKAEAAKSRRISVKAH
jgi:HSP20 family protein